MEFESDFNFDEVIKALEKKQETLTQDLEAQKALEEVIPIRLAENLETLKKHFPKLYERFKDYKLKEKYQLSCNSNGEANIVLTNGTTFYGNSPFKDCEEQVEIFLETPRNIFTIKPLDEDNPFGQLHFYYKNKIYRQAREYKEQKAKENALITRYDSVPLLIMFGLGLGYQLAYLYEKSTPVNIYIIEPNPDFFYLSLCVFDYTSLLDYISERHLGLKFYIDDKEEDFIRDLDIYTGTYGTSIALKGIYVHYNSDILKKFFDVYLRDMSSIQAKNGFFDDILIGVTQSAQNLLNKERFLTVTSSLDPKYESIPLLIVGNGPSLDQDLAKIKEINDKVCILACGTAITALVKYGIRVDFYVAVERTMDVRDSLLTIKDPEVFENVLCIAPDVIYPETIRLFKHRLLAFKFNEAMLTTLALAKIIPNYGEFLRLDYINPLVSNMGLVVGSYLGFKDLIFVGIDNGSAFEEAHSVYSYYYDDQQKLLDQHKNMTLNNLPLEFPGNFREKVKTNNLFKLSLRMMENIIKTYDQQINYYNASDGAKIGGAKPLHLNQVDWSKYPTINHNEIRDYIIENRSKSIDVTKEDLDKTLRKERFYEIIDILINDLDHLPEDRAEQVLRFEAHIDYIRDVIKEGIQIGAASILGSLVLYYSGYIIAIYAINDQKQAIKECKPILETIKDFLKDVKKFYPHTFEFTYEFGKEHIKPFY